MRAILDMGGVTVRYVALEPDRLVDFNAHLGPGERLTLVGESGAGKSTVLAAISGYAHRHAGWLRVDGIDPQESGANLRLVRSNLGIVRQSPRESLDPTQRVEDAVAEPLVHLKGFSSRKAREEARKVLAACGISGGLFARRPDSLSGGECQRVSVARALVHRPPLLLADEPTASLDPLVGQALLDLLRARTEELGTSLVYVTHTLREPERMGGQLAILLAGVRMEWIEDFSSWRNVRHPYSRYLADSRYAAVPPLTLAPPPGCPFSTLCPHADGRCRWELPLAKEVAPGHLVRCFAV
jgi:ABC-type dipeptide/oligopeptide/nickel transport system ATPase subunit